MTLGGCEWLVQDDASRHSRRMTLGAAATALTVICTIVILRPYERRSRSGIAGSGPCGRRHRLVANRLLLNQLAGAVGVVPFVRQV